MAAEASTHRVGTLFDGEYRLEAVLGRGAMGVVYRATRLGSDSGQQFAIKVLAQHGVADEVAAKRFRREGETLARLDHPNILRMLRLGVSQDGTPYLVTELIHGDTLRQILASQWPLEPGRLHSIALQLCLGLGYAHAMGGVVHRDIKPANILVTRAGGLKIVDFGIAKSLYAEHTALTDGILGSPAYMAPEQIVGQEVNFRTDIYAVGGLLYECLTGGPVFHGASVSEVVIAHLNKPPRHPNIDGSRLEGPLVDLVMQCLEKYPGKRPRSCNAMVDELSEMDPATCVRGSSAEDGPAPTVLLFAAAPASEETSEATVVLVPEATVTLHRKELAASGPSASEDPRAFQRVPLVSPEVLADMADPSLTAALQVGYRERVSSGMWESKSKERALPATTMLAEDAEALAMPERSPPPGGRPYPLLAAIAVAGVVLLVVIIALTTGGCAVGGERTAKTPYDVRMDVPCHPASLCTAPQMTGEVTP